jgi:hypothetical protein
MPDLAAGYAADEVGSPAIHLPLWGVASPEPDMRGVASGTLSGPTQADHPRLVERSSRSPRAFFPPFAARSNGLIVPRDFVEAA